MWRCICTGSNLSYFNRDVTLVVQECSEQIHLAANPWAFSNLSTLLILLTSQAIEAYSMSDLTRAT